MKALLVGYTSIGPNIVFRRRTCPRTVDHGSIIENVGHTITSKAVIAMAKAGGNEDATATRSGEG